MRTSRLTSVTLAAVVSLMAIAGPARAEERSAISLRPVVLGSAPSFSIPGDAHVKAGEVHEGDLVVIMGDARVEGTVTGQIVVVLGSLELTGEARSEVVTVLSDTTIGETARIRGQLVNVGGRLDRAPGSRVSGQVVSVSFMDFVPFLQIGGGWSSILWFFFLWKLVKLAGLFLLLILITALVPRRISVMAAAFPQRWGWAFIAGLLGYAGAVVGCFVLAVTIIGIPLAIALGFAVKVSKWLGLAAILFLIGQNAGRNLFGRDLSHLGCVLGGFVVYALLRLIPGFGTAFGLVMSFLALGIAMLTRFGTEVESPGGAAASGPPPGGEQPVSTTAPPSGGASPPTQSVEPSPLPPGGDAPAGSD